MLFIIFSSYKLTKQLPLFRRTTQHKLIAILFIFQLTLANSSARVYAESDSNNLEGDETKSSCSLYMDVGPNDLILNDIVVKSGTSNVACIKARFSLAIKVEGIVAAADNDDDDANNSRKNQSFPDPESKENGWIQSKRVTLGYLPLDSVLAVEDSCPDFKSPPTKTNSSVITPQTTNTSMTNGDEQQSEQQQQTGKPEETQHELEMIVSFECGKLAFYFKREKNYYLSAIKGVVNLDSNTIREFIAEQPMFFTSDLNHHFKFNELVEVTSNASTKGFYLSANFYNLEFETFRNTTSRSFIRPPDEHSKPFQV